MGKDSGKADQRQLLKRANKDRKLAEKQKQKIAKAQIKELRPFIKSLKSVDLRRNLTPQKRSFIDKAWSEYQELTSRPFKIYKTKSKKRLDMAQRYSRHQKGKPKFDVAFVPTPDPKAKLQFFDDRVVVKSKYVTESVILFDLKNLAANPLDEITQALARNTKAKQFVIMAGKYQYNGGLARSLVEGEILKLMARYANTDANNYFGNWLLGIIAAEYTDQKDVEAFRREFEKIKRAKLNDKKNERRRRGYKYGKKF